MDKPMKKCRICGKEYEACKPAYTSGNIYRWQDVACCAEHGAEYFALIEASRRKDATVDANTCDDSTDTVVDEKDVDSGVDAKPVKGKKRKTTE